MKPYVIGVRHGIVQLDETEMMRVVQYYHIQRTAEYIAENYPNISCNVETVASRVREAMEKYDISEDEAINQVIEEVKRESCSGEYTEYT